MIEVSFTGGRKGSLMKMERAMVDTFRNGEVELPDCVDNHAELIGDLRQLRVKDKGRVEPTGGASGLEGPRRRRDRIDVGGVRRPSCRRLSTCCNRGRVALFVLTNTP